MRAWRLCKPRHAATPLDGEGARREGGRWNHPGTAVAYFSDSPALATLELLVKVQDVRVLRNYVLIEADVPDDAIEDMDPSRLPSGWRAYPHTDTTRDVGDAWATSGRSLALRVPSVVVRGWNVLVNPAHTRLVDVQVEAPETDVFDPRLVGRP